MYVLTVWKLCSNVQGEQHNSKDMRRFSRRTVDYDMDDEGLETYLSG